MDLGRAQCSKSPVALRNITTSAINSYKHKLNSNATEEFSPENRLSTKKKQQQQVLSSQEIVSKYNNFIASTKSSNRASTNNLKRSFPHNLGEISNATFTHKEILFGEVYDQKENNFPLFNDSTAKKKSLTSSRSSAFLGNAGGDQERQIQIFKKIEPESLRESLQNEYFENDIQALKNQIAQKDEELKVAQRENKEMRRAIDQLSKAPDISLKIQQEMQILGVINSTEETGADDRKMKQILEKTEIESRLSKECDKLMSIIEDKDNQIKKLMEIFLNLKESHSQALDQKEHEIESISKALNEQALNERQDKNQAKQQNEYLQNRFDEIVKENDKLLLNCQMFQEQIQQNQQMIQQSSMTYQQTIQQQQIKIENLNSIIQSLKQKEKQLEEEVREQQRICEQISIQMNESKEMYEERIKEYTHVIDDLKEQVVEFEKEEDQLKNEFDFKQKEHINQEELISNLNQQLKQQQEREQQILGDHACKIQQSQLEQIRFEKQILELRQELNIQKNEQEREQSILSGKTQQSQLQQMRLEKQILELSDELNIQRNENERVIKEIAELQKINDELTLKNQVQVYSQSQQEREMKREIKKISQEHERTQFLLENKLKLLEKQHTIFQEKINEKEEEVTSVLKEKHDLVAQHQDQLLKLRRQIEQLKSDKEGEIEEKIKCHEEETKRLMSQIEELTNQINYLQEKYQRSEQENQQGETKRQCLLADASNAKQQLEKAQQEQIKQINHQKESERRFQEKAQQIMQKLTKDLNAKQQEVTLLKEEIEKLNKIINDQQIQLNQQKEYEQINIQGQSEDQLMISLGLGEVLSSLKRISKHKNNYNDINKSSFSNNSNNTNNLSTSFSTNQDNKFSFQQQQQYPSRSSDNFGSPKYEDEDYPQFRLSSGQNQENQKLILRENQSLFSPQDCLSQRLSNKDKIQQQELCTYSSEQKRDNQ